MTWGAQFLVVVFLYSVVWAQTPSSIIAKPEPLPKPPVKIQKVSGQPIIAKWPDGREAELRSIISSIFLGTPQFEVKENECTSAENLSCELKAQYKIYALKLVWAKNVDPNKIGKTVQMIFDNGEKRPIDFDGLVIFANTQFTPKIARGISPYEIACKDYSWLQRIESLNEKVSLLEQTAK